MSSAERTEPSFVAAFKVLLAVFVAPLIAEAAVYVSRPEVFPSYLQTADLIWTLLLGFIYFLLLFGAAAVLVALLVYRFHLPLARIVLSVLFALFCALTLSRSLPNDSGATIGRITAFLLSLLYGVGAFLLLRKYPKTLLRLSSGIVLYTAVSAFLLQHLFVATNPFWLLALLLPLLFATFIFLQRKVLIPVVVFAAVLFLQPKTLVDRFAPPVRINAYERVIVIGVDALSPETTLELVKQNKLPVIQRLLANGSFARLRTLNIPFSPLVWNTIYTGTTPKKHGVMAFTSTQITGASPFLSLWLDNWTNSDWFHRSVDALKKARLVRTLAPATGKSRLKPALWNIVNQNGVKTIVVGGWTSFPPEKTDGLFVSDYALTAKPSTPGTYFPVRKQVDDLLAFDPDASQWPSDMQRYIKRDLKEHHLLMNLVNDLDESTRFVFGYYSAPDAFGHHYGTRINMRDTAEKEREQFLMMRDKVYQMIDGFLSDLLQHIDERTLLVICSDHGFRYDKRQHNYKVDGMLIVYGANTRAGAQVDADVYSIAPTVLYALGMPLSNDFSGAPLKQLFTGTISQPTPVQYKNAREFFEVLSDKGFEEDKMQELEDLQYINR